MLWNRNRIENENVKICCKMVEFFLDRGSSDEIVIFERILLE